MKTEKLTVLEKAISDALEGDIIADGKEYYMHDNLHVEMARAAEAVYDSCMGGQKYAEDNE